MASLDVPRSIWGGLIDAMLDTKGGIDSLDEGHSLLSLYKRLQRIEQTTTLDKLALALEEVKFTTDDQNRLNSPLLDQLLSAKCDIGFAAGNGYTELVKFLIKRGADVHVENDLALSLASENGHTDTVRVLLDYGADIHADHDYPIFAASENGYTDIVKLLLDRGADLHGENDRALEFAAMNGHIDTVRVLLDSGADIHAERDGNKELPLIMACDRGHTDVVELLLDRGANIHAERDKAINYAYIGRHIPVIKLLVERGAFYGDVLGSAVRYNIPEISNVIFDTVNQSRPRKKKGGRKVNPFSKMNEHLK